MTLGLVLAFEPPEPGVMRRPPRAGRCAAAVALPALAGVSGLGCCSPPARSAIFFYALERGAGVETARTMVVNTLVVLEIFYLFNVRYLHMTSITCAARSARRRC